MEPKNAQGSSAKTPQTLRRDRERYIQLFNSTEINAASYFKAVILNHFLVVNLTFLCQTSLHCGHHYLLIQLLALVKLAHLILVRLKLASLSV